MNYDEILQAAIPKMPGYSKLSDAAKELLAVCNALDLKNAAECRASLAEYQQEKGFDDTTLWGTVALSSMELAMAGFVKRAGVDIQKKLFLAVWTDALKEAALKEGEQ